MKNENPTKIKGRPRVGEISINLTLTKDLIDRMDKFARSQTTPCSRAAVARVALERFLPIIRADKIPRTFAEGLKNAKS